MQLGIDITPIIYQRGVSRYTANLVRALLASPELSLSVYAAAGRQKKWLTQQVNHWQATNKRLHQTIIKPYPQSLHTWSWEHLRWPPVRQSLPNIEVFHAWEWVLPPDRDLPLVVTLHDLAMLKFPATAHPRVLDHHRRVWHQLVQRRCQVIAVSQVTAQDVEELLEVPRSQITVIPEALPEEFRVVGSTLSDERYQSIKSRLQLDKPYILAVGTREPRKNLPRLIQAWQPLANEVELVIVGEAGWDDSTAFMSRGLRFLDRVSDEELAVLYTEAEIFAYPSLYEGFGLPILEAYFSGTPVVTSNVSSMPEVAGNAAVLVDPLSVEGIRAGLQEILGESLPQQQQRLQKMILRLQLFDWTKTAKATLQVYRRAIAEGKGRDD